MDGYCIMCGKRKSGIEVRNDFVIDSIRWVKRNITRDEKGHRLVICKEDYPDYKKRYDKYRSRQMLYVALGLIFLILAIIAFFNIGTILLCIILLLVLYAFSLLSYMPALNLPKGAKGKA